MTDLIFLSAMTLASILMLILERRGAKVVLSLSFKGDIKRESRWLAQFGQGACTIAVASLLICMDNQRRFKFHFSSASLLLTGVFGASLICTGIKRILGRVRPNRENAGKFLGFTWRHDNSRESFPSSHSAAAVAMAVVLSRLYPPAAPVVWTLALICAGLRYVMDAHWPSDVLAGVALGHGLALGLCMGVM
jgi:membrane-associated phospholipid phosphatase